MPQAILTICLSILLQAGAPRTHEYDAAWEFDDARVTVRVIDQAGKPVPGAEAICFEGQGRAVFLPMSNPEKATTDSDGVCTFNGLRARNYTIYARSGRLGCWTAHRPRPETKSAQVEARLGPYLTSEGVVRDGAGEALPGVAVIFRGVLIDTTDEAGRFRIPHIEWSPSSPTAIFVKEGFGAVSRYVWPHAQVMTIIMRDGAKVRVKVLGPDGNPLADHEVTYDMSSFWVDTATGRAGDFTTCCLPLGKPVNVYARMEKDGIYYNASARFSPEADGPNEVTVRLEPQWRIHLSETPTPEGRFLKTYLPVTDEPGARLTGRVVQHLSNRPVMATVVCEQEDEVKARTQPNGSFAFEYLPEGRARLFVYPDDPLLYCPETPLRLRLSKDEAEPERLFVARKGGAIQGQLLRSNGLPARGVRLNLKPPVKSNPGPHALHIDGTFHIGNLPPTVGKQQLVAKYASDEESLTIVDVGPLGRGRLVDDIVIKLPPQPEEEQIGELSGTVVDAGGNPVPALHIELPADYGVNAAVTDEDGCFALAYRKSGAASLSAKKRLYYVYGEAESLETVDVQIVEGAEVELTKTPPAKPVRVVVCVPEPPIVAGSVRDEEGNPINPAPIRR